MHKKHTPSAQQAQEPFSLDQCSCPVVVIDLKNNFTAISSSGAWDAAFSRCSPLAVSPALPPGPYTVQLYSVLTAVSAITGQVSTREGRGTPTHPKHCAGLSNNRQGSPHPHVLASSARCESITRDERRKKKGKRGKTPSEAFTKSVQGGGGRGPGPPAHVKRADLPHSPSPYDLACTVRAHPTGNHQSPGASLGRSPNGTRQVEERNFFLTRHSDRCSQPPLSPPLFNVAPPFCRPRALPPPSKGPLSRDKRRYGLPETPDLAGPRQAGREWGPEVGRERHASMMLFVLRYM